MIITSKGLFTIVTEEMNEKIWISMFIVNIVGA